MNAEIGIKELRMLAEIERQMDRGEIPWVRVEGFTQRASIMPETMTVLGLETGQTITWFMFGEICQLQLEMCREALAKERTEKLVAEELAGEGL